MVNASFLLLRKLNIKKPYKMTCPAAGGQAIRCHAGLDPASSMFSDSALRRNDVCGQTAENEHQRIENLSFFFNQQANTLGKNLEILRQRVRCTAIWAYCKAVRPALWLCQKGLTSFPGYIMSRITTRKRLSNE